MSSLLLNLEWLNHNAQRSYPLADDATGKDETGSFTLPNDFLLELYFPVHASADSVAENFFLRTVASFPGGYTLGLGYDDGSGAPPVVASVTIAKATHQENTSYPLVGIANTSVDFADSIGRVVIGRLDTIDAQPTGLFQFAPAGGRLDPDCIRPTLRGVSRLRVANGTEVSEPIVDDVILVAGSNMRLSVTRAAGQDTVITFDAIDGAGLTEDCVCTDEDLTAPPIRTINDIPPDPAGRFTFLDSDCVQITPIANGLQFIDTCSKPCCGCQELEKITRDVEQFGNSATSLTNYVNRLEATVTQFSNVVLGSRLADGGCVAAS